MGVTPEQLEAIREELNKKFKKTEKKVFNVKELKEYIKEFNQHGDSTIFNDVDWSKIVTDKEFTEDMVYMFQNHIQLYFEDYIKSHKPSIQLLKDMYHNMVGVFNLSWVDEDTRKLIVE